MSWEAPPGTGGEGLAKPLHVQHIEQALRLEPLLDYVEGFVTQTPYSDLESSTDGDSDAEGLKVTSDGSGNKLYNGVLVSKSERRADKQRLYNLNKVKKSRRWLKNILLSDTSSDEEDGPSAMTHESLQEMLRLHKYQREIRTQFYQDKELHRYQYYSVGLLSDNDKFHEHQRAIVGPKKKVGKDQKKLDKIKKAKLKKMKGEDGSYDADLVQMLADGSITEEQLAAFEAEERAAAQKGSGRHAKPKKLTPEQIAAKRRKLWISNSKKEIPRAQKQKVAARKEIMTSLRKVSKECQKECRRAALQSQKIMKEAAGRARRLSREMQVYWKRFEKVEKEHRKKAEKEAHEQHKMDMEIVEMKRQQRKLNFLITQTELYAHFMSRKLTGSGEDDKKAILGHLDEESKGPDSESSSMAGDDYDPEDTKKMALQNAHEAYQLHQFKKNTYDADVAHKRMKAGDTSSFANPLISTEVERPQPAMFEGTLKSYQMKGMNWLANLYDQGINGILADEMGLGKTVQSIAFLAHLAEAQLLWGPFLIIAPASTLHNWQQEFSRFTPEFKKFNKFLLPQEENLDCAIAASSDENLARFCENAHQVVPYWGNTQDRKVLRKFWNQDHLYTRDASFHVVITSYQLVIQDVKYFQRIKWHYMILDEAQAIKSTASVRWKILLGFNCRNRLLLTGTPIQNTMAELWALLHYIMPTLFDSHEEFNDWFSKDIESHVESQSGIDENQLSRLHMILKPFMLRRVKKDVENELSDKIEILVYCPLTMRQRLLYQGIKNKISIEDLLQSTHSAATTAQSSTSSLMNLVMQFRKVCNHPELFERRDINSPFFIRLPPYHLPKLIYRDGTLNSSFPGNHHLIYNKLCIHNSSHIHQSLFHQCAKDSAVCNSTFSFMRFIDLSPAEMNATFLQGLLFRWLLIFLWHKNNYHIHHQTVWHPNENNSSSRLLLLSPLTTTSPPNTAASPNLQALLFLSTTSTFLAFNSITLHSMRETPTHRKIRLRRAIGRPSGAETIRSPKRGPLSPPGSPIKSPISPTRKSLLDMVFDEQNTHMYIMRPSKTLKCQRTDIPAFLYNTKPKVRAADMGVVCHDRSAAWDVVRAKLCSTLHAKKCLLYGTAEIAEQVRWARYYFNTTVPAGLVGAQPRHGFSGVTVPDKEMLVTDAGKLSVLDSLLLRLKQDGHRVLIYSQMTRMIDLLEEYMWHRKHTYMRLDGSSKISERRDMVADFQQRTDIFVFLLSTRAGGLGINLTAADTVIFYDSDWNPTVDQQAMDRAHRLGQTKQVTVYRLICKGSIEERILQRAREKSEIQRMVISGGQFRPDVLRPKEVVSLLLDDDEMERKLRMRVDEKDRKSDGYKDKDRDRKRQQYQRVRTGRGPGRPKKMRVDEDQNTTIPATSDLHHNADSNLSMDSISATNSPLSVMSGSELHSLMHTPVDDSSNDALVIVDDNSCSSQPIIPSAPPPPSSSSTPKRGTGRPRGRPKGSGVGRRPRGRGSVLKAITAAEAAAKAHCSGVDLVAAARTVTPPPIRGRGLMTRGGRGAMRGGGVRGSAMQRGRGGPRGFYTQS